MKLYTEEQVKQIFENLSASSGYDYNMETYCDSLTPIELPSHRDITERATQQVDKTIDNYFVGFAACSEYYEQILNQNKIKPNAPITSTPIYTGIGIISKEIICVSGNSVMTN